MLPTFPFRVGGAEAGATDAPSLGVILPEVVLQRTRDDTRVALGLDSDISKSAADSNFKNQYAAWLTSWKEFAGKVEESWWMRFQSATVNEILRREEDLRQWRAKFESAGGKATAPPPAQDPADPLANMADKALGGAASLGVSAAVIAVVGGAVYLLHGRRA